MSYAKYRRHLFSCFHLQCLRLKHFSLIKNTLLMSIQKFQFQTTKFEVYMTCS